MIRKNSHLRMARYHQHLHELLDLDISPLDYMLKSFPDVKEREEMRKIIGRYGLTGRQQVCRFEIYCCIIERSHICVCKMYSIKEEGLHSMNIYYSHLFTFMV